MGWAWATTSGQAADLLSKVEVAMSPTDTTTISSSRWGLWVWGLLLLHVAGGEAGGVQRKALTTAAAA